MSRGGDVGRAEVYAAELAAFDGTELESVVGQHDAAALVARITAAAWWPPDRRVELRVARRDASSSHTRWVQGRTIVSLAATQRTPATVVHELAHVLAGPQARHGPVFRRAHVDLACEAFGAGRGAWLEAAYRDAGLALGPRWWAATGSTAIAL